MIQTWRRFLHKLILVWAHLNTCICIYFSSLLFFFPYSLRQGFNFPKSNFWSKQWKEPGDNRNYKGCQVVVRLKNQIYQQTPIICIVFTLTSVYKQCKWLEPKRLSNTQASFKFSIISFWRHSLCIISSQFSGILRQIFTD